MFVRTVEHLAAHSAIPLPCKTSRPLTVQFPVIATCEGIRCSPRFFNVVKVFCFFFSEELCSNTRTAGGGRQKRPIQQKILKSRNTNPPHYRQTSLASHRALPCNTDDCAVLLSAFACICVCVCVFSFSRPQQRVLKNKHLSKCRDATSVS